VPEEGGALAGVRVVDTATLIAGPMVGTYLGELGADVIKVEQPGAGDPLRTWGAAKDGIGLVWKSVSRNKRCVTLDLRQGEGQAVLHELLDGADVVILGSRPSALARWGLSPADVLARHPGLIVLHVSGYGAGGPFSDRPGYGTLAEAMSGFAHLVGEPDGPPSLPPFMLADGVAALTATNAVTAALYHRDVRGGGGQVIDVNLIEPLARLIESATLSYDQPGGQPPAVRQPLRRQRAAELLPDQGRRLGGDIVGLAADGAACVRRRRPSGHGRRPRLLQPGRSPGPRRRDRPRGGRLDRAAVHRRRHGDLPGQRLCHRPRLRRRGPA
jgi:crotonobetainyl-CoA:carnitine CoA-transferase CaiB-like acyl-CoA transferase